MSLPPWAIRALDHFKPLPSFRDTEPDPERLRQWNGFRARFERRWRELAPEKWRVPEHHPAYGWLRLNYTYPPAEYVRQGILECAIESAWEMGANKKPSRVVEAVRELDRLNDEISKSAAELAKLFRDREQLKTDFGLSDLRKDAEEWFPDPFRLLGALEMALTADRERVGNSMDSEELRNFFTVIAASGTTQTPEWPIVLDEVAQRLPRSVTSMEAGDIAVVGSRTNKSPWSPWALRLVARLSDWAGNGLPNGFFLECLTHDQLATLAAVSVDAPPEAYNAAQMRELIKRHKARSSK